MAVCAHPGAMLRPMSARPVSYAHCAAAVRWVAVASLRVRPLHLGSDAGAREPNVVQEVLEHAGAVNLRLVGFKRAHWLSGVVEGERHREREPRGLQARRSSSKLLVCREEWCRDVAAWWVVCVLRGALA